MWGQTASGSPIVLFKAADHGLGPLAALLGDLVVQAHPTGIIGDRLAIDPRADQQEKIGLADPTRIQMHAEALDRNLLHLAELDASEVDTFNIAGQRVDFLGVCRQLAVRAVPCTPIFVMETVDGLVEDLLNQPVRAPLHIDAADHLQKRPDDVLPALVRVGVPAARLDVD